MRFWNEIVKWCTASAFIAFLIMIALICADVLVRTVFNSPIPVATELVVFCFAITTFLALVLVVRDGRELKVEIISSRLRGRLASGFNLFYSLLGIVAFSMIFLSVADKFIWSVREGDYIPSDPNVPTAVPWGAITLGLFLYIIQHIIQMFGYLKSTFQSK